MNIKQLLEKHSIAPKKSMDQIFLQDEKILDLEVGLAQLKPGDTVLEIGAGTGNLTRQIAEKCKAVAIEKDERFLPLLEKIPNATVIPGDALRVLGDARKNEISLAFNKIVSNIPYSRSQEILIELLQHRWQKAVLCVQKEFAEKLQGKRKLGIVINHCCDLSVACGVPAAAFYPEAVDSSIIVLEQRRLLDFEFWQFLDFVYRKKNRNVKNVIKNAPTGLAKKKVHQLTTDELKRLFESY